MKKRLKITTNDIAVASIFLALILLFVFVPINIFGIDIAFIPLIAIFIAANVRGLGMGLFSGVCFGLASLAASFLRPTVFSPIFHNPLVSVVPRMIIPITTYYTFRFVKHLLRRSPQEVSASIASACSAVVGVVTNTALVVSMIVAFNFGKTYGDTVIGGAFVLGLLGVNFLIEVLSCAVITPGICVGLRLALRIDKKGRRDQEPTDDEKPNVEKGDSSDSGESISEKKEREA